MSHRPRIALSLVALTLAAQVAVAVAADPPPHPATRPAPSTLPVPSEPEAIHLGVLLESGTPAEQKAALAKITRLVRKNPEAAQGLFADHWRENLFNTRRFKDAAILCQTLINSLADDTQLIVRLQPYRARALLYEGGYEKALFAAKGFYNVCPLEQANAASDLIIECLKDARKGEPDATERFQSDQVAGTDPASLPRPASAKPTFLQSVKPTPEIGDMLQKAVTRFTGDDYPSLLGRGNLLLLADQPDDALKVFQTAYQIAPEDKLPEATESIARAIKAQDGATGRAAAWLRQHRPTP